MLYLPDALPSPIKRRNLGGGLRMTDVWYYSYNEQRVGPFSLAGLHAAVFRSRKRDSDGIVQSVASPACSQTPTARTRRRPADAGAVFAAGAGSQAALKR